MFYQCFDDLLLLKKKLVQGKGQVCQLTHQHEEEEQVGQGEVEGS
jgi:hypothetical protein